MLIGHLPAGYLAAKGARVVGASRALFLGMIVGSVAPDIDMLWFHLVDHGSVHHHEYLTHRPIVWAVLLFVGVLTRKNWLAGIGLGGILHMLLDSIAGQITWGWPFFDASTTLVVVQATHDHWVKSFMAHWTFQVELALTAVAIAVFLRANFIGKST